MFRDKRPPISLESDQAVDRLYDYYGKKDPNALFMRFMFHPAMAALYRSKVAFEGDSEALIGDHLASGRQLLVPVKHTSMHDPTVLAGVMLRRKSLRPMIAKTVAPGKADLFGLPMVGWIVSNSGAYPVVRRKDFEKLKPQAGNPDELEARKRKAGSRVVDISIEKFNRSFNVVIFPEGKRHQGDAAATKLLDLRGGAGRIACGIDSPEDALIVCGAVNYEKGSFRPSVALGYPMAVAETPEEVMADIGVSLQACAEMALELSLSR